MPVLSTVTYSTAISPQLQVNIRVYSTPTTSTVTLIGEGAESKSLDTTTAAYN